MRPTNSNMFKSEMMLRKLIITDDTIDLEIYFARFQTRICSMIEERLIEYTER